jgi:predicted permease
MMRTLIQDVRYGIRMLVKNPGFTAVAALTLALAIGANTAIFTVINALVLKSLPVEDKESLVILGDPSRVHSRSGGTPTVDTFSFPLYKVLTQSGDVFSNVFASADPRRLRVAIDTNGNQQEEPGRGRLVTGEYFTVLDVKPAIGRLFGNAEADAAHPTPVAVISYSYWTRKFQRNPSIVGQAIRLNNSPVTVIGVTEPGFEGEIHGELQDVFIPMSMQPTILPGKQWLESPTVSWMQVMGRLKPGLTLEQGKARINVLFKQAVDGPYGATLTNDDRQSVRKENVEVVSGARGFSFARDQLSRPMMMLMGIVGLVLLVACINVSNMLLARSSARQKEIALRLAIGASPRRIVRQLLTESVLLALVGGVLGLFIAQAGTKLLLRWAGQQFTSLSLDTSFDLRVLLFTAGVCVITGVLFGLVPAVRALRTELSASMQAWQMSPGFGRGRLMSAGNLLVAGQVAVSLLVLFAAGMLVRSLHNLEQLDLGFQRENLVVLQTDPMSGGIDPAKLPALMTQIIEAVRTIPGVTAATGSENGLFSGTESGENVNVEGFTPNREDDTQIAFDSVGPNYFSSLGIPVLLGREIRDSDTATSPHVAVINETMAKFYFGDANPIGRKVALQPEEYRDRPPYEIVGVTRDVRDHSLRDKVERRMYTPVTQSIADVSTMNLEVKIAGDPRATLDAIRARVRSIDSALPITAVRTIQEQTDRVLVRERLMAKLAGLFGGLAFILSAIGIYGLMSYLVVSRTKEIGIRMALGAKRSQILGAVLRHSALLAGLGIAIGVPLAFAGSRAMRSVLFEVGSIDPVAMGLAVAGLGAAAIFAALVPARTATKVDPMIALRYE